MTIRVRQLQSCDNAELLRLIQDSPQKGAVSLNFERNPDYFHAAHVNCESPAIWGIEGDNQELLAMISLGTRSQYINGHRASVTYVHDVRIASHARNGRILYYLSSQVRPILKSSRWIQSVILADNRVSKDTLTASR